MPLLSFIKFSVWDNPLFEPLFLSHGVLLQHFLHFIPFVEFYGNLVGFVFGQFWTLFHQSVRANKQDFFTQLKLIWPIECPTPFWHLLDGHDKSIVIQPAFCQNSFNCAFDEPLCCIIKKAHFKKWSSTNFKLNDTVHQIRQKQISRFCLFFVVAQVSCNSLLMNSVLRTSGNIFISFKAEWVVTFMAQFRLSNFGLMPSS